MSADATLCMSLVFGMVIFLLYFVKKLVDGIDKM